MLQCLELINFTNILVLTAVFFAWNIEKFDTLEILVYGEVGLL